MLPRTECVRLLPILRSPLNIPKRCIRPAVRQQTLYRLHTRAYTSPSISPAFDHLPVQFGQRLNDRYEILRKIGSGMYSTTWLVLDHTAEYKDNSTSRFTAAKVLTREGTQAHDDGISRELEFLQDVKAAAANDGLPLLRDHFRLTGPEGEHLCFITDLLCTDVRSYAKSAPKGSLPVHVVSNILERVLEAVMNLHTLKIIHTDLKLDNILFDNATDPSVYEWLAAEPAILDGEVTVGGAKYPIFRSQPFPHGLAWNLPVEKAELIGLAVIDLGHAQRAGEQPTVDEFSALALRAPEVILMSSFSPRIDIWVVGCLTYEMLTGKWLFKPEEGPSWTREEDHLARMMELTGERFHPEELAHAHRRAEFLDEQGTPLRRRLRPRESLESALAANGTVPEEKIPEAASFIRACLRINSADRATARDLLVHPFLKNSICG